MPFTYSYANGRAYQTYTHIHTGPAHQSLPHTALGGRAKREIRGAVARVETPVTSIPSISRAHAPSGKLDMPSNHLAVCSAHVAEARGDASHRASAGVHNQSSS